MVSFLCSSGDVRQGQCGNHESMHPSEAIDDMTYFKNCANSIQINFLCYFIQLNTFLTKAEKI